MQLVILRPCGIVLRFAKIEVYQPIVLSPYQGLLVIAVDGSLHCAAKQLSRLAAWRVLLKLSFALIGERQVTLAEILMVTIRLLKLNQLTIQRRLRIPHPPIILLLLPLLQNRTHRLPSIGNLPTKPLQCPCGTIQLRGIYAGSNRAGTNLTRGCVCG